MEVWNLCVDAENGVKQYSFKSYDDSLDFIKNKIYDLVEDDVIEDDDVENVIGIMEAEIAEGAFQFGDTVYHLNKTNVIGG